MGARDEKRLDLERIRSDWHSRYVKPRDSIARRLLRSLSGAFRAEPPDGEFPNLSAIQERGTPSLPPWPVASKPVQDRPAPRRHARGGEEKPAGAPSGDDIMAALDALARSGRAPATAVGDRVRPAGYIDVAGKSVAVTGFDGDDVTGDALRGRPSRIGEARGRALASLAARPADRLGQADTAIRQRVLDRVAAADLNRLGGEAPPRQTQGDEMDTQAPTPLPVNDPGLAGLAGVAAALAPETAAAAERVAAGTPIAVADRPSVAPPNPGQFPGSASIVHRASAAMADVHGHTLNTLNALKAEIDALITRVESHRERATAELSAFVASADQALRHADAIKKSLGVIGEAIE